MQGGGAFSAAGHAHLALLVHFRLITVTPREQEGWAG